MKPRRLLLILLVLLFGTSQAQGQGFRGSMGFAPGGGTLGQAGSISRSGPSGSQSS